MNRFFRFFNKYFTTNVFPHWCVFIFDCLIVLFSSLLVHVLIWGVSHTAAEFWPLLGIFNIYLLFYIVGFYLFHTYKFLLRYSSFFDLQRIGCAMLVGITLILISHLIFHVDHYFVEVRLRELFFTFILCTTIIFACRVFIKYLYDISFSMAAAKGVFIYGVDGTSFSLAKHIYNQRPAVYILKGFVSDTHEMDKRVVLGANVYPNDESLVEIMHKRNAEILLISQGMSEVLRNNDKMVNVLIYAGIHLMVVQTAEWNESGKGAPMAREINIEDLLPREQIDVDLDFVADQLKGKNVLITGSAGSIGSEIVRQVAEFKPAQLILIDQAETPQHDIRLMMAKQYPDIPAQTIVMSVCQEGRMDMIFSQYRPDYVFHAAAYKHVPMLEDNPCESVYNNVVGTRIVADMAVKYGTKKFVMISTDKAVNPTNVMGCSKRICEMYVQSLDKAIKTGQVKGITRFVTTRFGNVLGSNGSVIPLFREQIKNGGPLTVTDPRVIRYFMLIPEACKLVLEAGTHGEGGEIFVFDMGKPVKIDDLARRMIQLSGAKDVKIAYTGLRHGEKLYEEMLNKEEDTMPSFHPKIKVAKVRQFEYQQIKGELEELNDISLNYDNMRCVMFMKMMVPEYISSNSPYTVIDEELDHVQML